MRIILFIALSLISLETIAADSVSVNVRLIESKGSYKDWIFRITITNNHYDKLDIQDTILMQRATEEGYFSHVVPFFESKRGNKYHYVNIDLKWLGFGIDSCLLFCCNCISIKNSQSISFDVKLFKGVKIPSGKFRVQVYFHTPSLEKTPNGFYAEYLSNYFYISIPKDQNTYSPPSNPRERSASW